MALRLRANRRKYRGDTNIHTFKQLFNWWRGDNGILPHGMEMPSQEDQRVLRLVCRSLQDDTIGDAMGVMVAEGWFRGMEQGSIADFKQWLEEMRADGR